MKMKSALCYKTRRAVIVFESSLAKLKINNAIGGYKLKLEEISDENISDNGTGNLIEV